MRSADQNAWPPLMQYGSVTHRYDDMAVVPPVLAGIGYRNFL